MLNCAVYHVHARLLPGAGHQPAAHLAVLIALQGELAR